MRSQAQSLALALLSPADQAMFSAIRSYTPAHIWDDTVAQAMTEAKRNGIHDISRIRSISLHADGLHVTGATPGYRGSVDVTATAPSLAQSADLNASQNQARQQQLTVQVQEQDRAQAQARGIGMG